MLVTSYQTVLHNISQQCRYHLVINFRLQYAHETHKFPDPELFSFWSLFFTLMSSGSMKSAVTGT